MFDLFADTQVKSTPLSISYNTDCIFDMQSGYALRGHDGRWLINGGWGTAVAGVQSLGGMYKSTQAGSLLMRTTGIYKTQAVIADSEDAISRDRDRLVRMSGDHPISIGEDGTRNQVICLDCKVEYDLDSLFKYIIDLGEKRLKHKKDLTITTPFVDPKTGERIKTWQPTPLFIDSVTELYSNEELSQISVGLDDKKTKTVYMIDANKKTLLLRWLSKFCTQYGFVCCMTAHFGETINIDTYGPSAKQLQHMKQGCKAKGAGSKFNFLTSPLYQTISAKVLEDDSKECWYKFGDTRPTDINEVALMMQRCKNNVSGSTFSYIISQTNGLLADVTDYHYLRSNKLFGMEGNPQNHKLNLYPNQNITRNSVRELSYNNKKFRRALQLTAQLLYIQKFWNATLMPFDIRVSAAQLFDALNSDKNAMSIEHILESRGYWLPAELETKDTPHYLSIFDVLEFVDQNKLIKK